jgi:hypothetical protein
MRNTNTNWRVPEERQRKEGQNNRTQPTPQEQGPRPDH